MKYTAIYFKMNLLHQIKESLLHLAFPHICEGCGTDVLEMEHELCLKCLAALPHTNFHLHADNPIEKIFWGRLPVQNAAALFYFTKESLMQHLMHQLKYRGNKELGFYLGKLMGESIAASNRFKQIDGLVPLPLFKSKEKKRGYNQATVLCEGISKVLEKPVFQLLQYVALSGSLPLILRSIQLHLQNRSRVELDCLRKKKARHIKQQGQ